MKKLIIVSKTRFILFLFVLFIIFSAIMSGMLSVNAVKSCDTDVRVYTASRNDTLWTIAEKFSEEDDVRQFVYDIKKANNLKTSCISEGQTIKIPY